MSIIKRIISFIINLFKRLFSKKKVTKKIKKELANAKNKHYLKGYGSYVEDSFTEIMPIYLLIDNEKKEELVKKIKEVENKLLTIDNFTKENVFKEFKNLSTKLDEKSISFYQNEKINDKLDELLNDKELNINTISKLGTINSDIQAIINNFDKSISDRVYQEYKAINYITVSNLILDETIEEIRKIEENYKYHRFNKLYYERELNKIKLRIESLKKVRDSKKVTDEIMALRKELYTKSKDKYDLLYNDEVFTNLEKSCDEILMKVNRKVIDLKKDNKLVKEKKAIDKEKDKKEEQEKIWEENILKRYEDLELARKLISLNQKKELNIETNKDFFIQLNQFYFEFLNGEKIIFNFERNKDKTELVKLYNNIGVLNALLTKEEFIFKEHINYQMDNLIDDTFNKKEELESNLKRIYNYDKKKDENSILVNNRLSIMKEKEDAKKKEKGPVLVKKANEKKFKSY